MNTLIAYFSIGFSACKYFSVFLRNLNTIYGQNLKNTDIKCAEEGVACITTNREFQCDTEQHTENRRPAHG